MVLGYSWHRQELPIHLFPIMSEARSSCHTTLVEADEVVESGHGEEGQSEALLSKDEGEHNGLEYLGMK